MQDRTTSTDVVVAGAGPTGLSLALTLTRLDIDVLIVDPLPGPVTESRANLMHAGSLERLHTLGVAEQLVDRGASADRSEIRSDGRLLAVSDWTALDSRFPMALVIAQSATESVLDEALTAGGAGVARGWAVTDFTHANEVVDVELTGDGGARSVTARFLVGCDGAHSAVRERLGVGFSGRSYPEQLLVADCTDADVCAGFSGVFFTQRQGFLVATGMRDRLTRIGASMEADVEPTESAVAALVASRSHGLIEPTGVPWSNLFRTQRRQVERMRVGRVVLAGDAAHVHSPAGGQGMNLGIRDAFDLGHRLAVHLRGGAPIETLDEYDELRRAEAERVLAATHRLLRMYAATGVARRLADTVVRIGDKVGQPSARLAIAMSGINTPWPPGARRPSPARDDRSIV